MRLCRFLQHGLQRCCVQLQVVFPGATHRAHDVPTAVGGLGQGQGVLGQVSAVGQRLGQFVLHFSGDQFDGGQRRAHLMRGGGDDAAQMLQLLFAGQGHLRGEQRVGHRRQLARDAARIGGEKHHADQDRDPMRQLQDGRHHQVQRRVIQGRGQPAGKRDHHHRHHPDHDGLTIPQSGRGNGHRHQHQQREGVRHAPRQPDQRRDLHEVEDQLPGSAALRDPRGRGGHPQVQRRPCPHQQQRWKDREADANQPRGQDRRQLPGKRDPAQQNQGAAADRLGPGAVAGQAGRAKLRTQRHR